MRSVRRASQPANSATSSSTVAVIGHDSTAGPRAGAKATRFTSSPAGTSAQKAQMPEYVAGFGAAIAARTAEWMPSAPTNHIGLDI